MPLRRWLVKSDPDEYSAHDLARDGRTTWEGVTSAPAQKHMREMQAGDAVLVYHTGDEKSIVARARVATPPRPDPGDPAGKRVVVELAFDEWLRSPVPLAAIKADRLFADFGLVRIGRLSVMPVSLPQWNRIEQLAAGADATDRKATPARTEASPARPPRKKARSRTTARRR